jgi:hypothetical protein
MVKLTPEQIENNWKEFLGYIDRYVTGDRKQQLLDLYELYEEHIVLAPASITETNHNCMPGGYVDHINRVILAALELEKVWQSFEMNQSYTQEELIFTCINHDLGKLGLPNIPGVLPNDNNWEIEKLGRHYKINTELCFMTVPDRTLYVLQSQGITVTENEYIAIKTHDGLYDEANKSYLISYQPESRLRSALALIVHQADMLAARVEWERGRQSKSTIQKTTVKKTAQKAISQVQQQALVQTVTKTNNKAFLEALKGI